MALIKDNGLAVPSKSTFAELLLEFSQRFPIRKVFEDFLTIAITACTQNPSTNQSHYEEEYLRTIGPYNPSGFHVRFIQAFTLLVVEMEQRRGSPLGNDVLGDFYQQHFMQHESESLASYEECCFMVAVANTIVTETKPQSVKSWKILDPLCRSGRMLMAGHEIHGASHSYYGVDGDRTFVKMAAINLFLNGMWGSEVMCANLEIPGHFVISYKISRHPFGIFKIEEKEKSNIWQRCTDLF